MPQPHPFPCGGEGQQPCPPQPADPIQLNHGDVFTVGGQSFVIGDIDEQAPEASEVAESGQSSEAADVMTTPTWQSSGQIWIRQTDPLPQVSGITMLVAIGG